MKIIFESVSGITWESRDTRIVNFTRRQKLQEGDSGGYLKQVIPQGGRFDLDVEDGSTIFAGRMKRDSTVLEVAASMVLPRGGVVTVESRECAVLVFGEVGFDGKIENGLLVRTRMERQLGTRYKKTKN